MNIERLFPLIVPSNYISSSWNLPNQKFPLSQYLLTWVEFENDSAMSYLRDDEFINLNQTYKNWQQQTFENLREEGNYFHTHVTHRKDTKQILYITFLNPDGIGSSRILLNAELSKSFPKGYYIAFPDRSCGLVISKDITHFELEDIKLMVKDMHKNATTAMSNQVYEPESFLLPSAWISPLDEHYSQQLVNTILGS